MELNWDDVRSTVDEVVVELRRLPSIDGLGAPVQLKSWPYGCCGMASNVIGTYLWDRGLGVWYVAHTGSHDWLEYLVDGEVEFSVDVTMHQFPSYAEPFCDWGVSPLRRNNLKAERTRFDRLPENFWKGNETGALDAMRTVVPLTSK